MVWLKRGIIALLVLVVVAAGVIVATGNGPRVKLLYDLATGAPDQPFDPADAAAAPDYSEETNWAALPWRDDPADLVPQGVEPDIEPGSAPVDVFFIHPTGFLKGSSWTYSMNPDTSSEENTRWMMANNASAFNGCCNVYAPRYRQATIFTYFGTEEATRDAVLGFAYSDVERAFDYFIEQFNEDRPFVLASHSQGTHHGIRLLQERIDGTALADRMVAAYLIGGMLEQSEFDELHDVDLCDSPDQLRCAVHWDTWSETTMEDHETTDVVCTNPLSWRLAGGLAESDQHVGAMLETGEYHVDLSGDDRVRGVVFGPLKAPIPANVHAQCAGGKLYITDQSDTPFAERGIAGNYHGLDYTMFYMDIRDNAKLRVERFLERNATSDL